MKKPIDTVQKQDNKKKLKLVCFISLIRAKKIKDKTDETMEKKAIGDFFDKEKYLS